MYLSATTAQYFERPDLYGCMFSYRKTGRQDEALRAGCRWMLDNGAFTKNFKFSQWVYWLAEMFPYRKNCIGVITPDEPFNATATIRKFYQYRSIPEALGYRVAFATQDGMTFDMVPWTLFDVLFVGGSDAHKRGPEAEALGKEARRREKWVHIGRVSAASTKDKYWTWANSFDGTTFCFDGGNTNVQDKLRLFNPSLANHGEYIQWRMI